MEKRQIILLVLVIVLGLAAFGVTLFLVRRGVQQPQSAVPSRADSGDVTECQGNASAQAKCFDCKKDASASSVVNILDFSCFTKFYGQNVGQ